MLPWRERTFLVWWVWRAPPAAKRREKKWRSLVHVAADAWQRVERRARRHWLDLDEEIW